MKLLRPRPEETHAARWEETPPSRMNPLFPLRTRPLLIPLMFLVLLAVLGALLLQQASTRNSSQPAPHWIALHLVGTGRSNFAAIGARVTVSAGDKSWTAWVRGQDASHATNPLYFDVALLRSVDVVEIFWPDGRVERLTGLSVDRSYSLREGASTA